jgi:hypothetical protein
MDDEARRDWILRGRQTAPTCDVESQLPLLRLMSLLFRRSAQRLAEGQVLTAEIIYADSR